MGLTPVSTGQAGQAGGAQRRMLFVAPANGAAVESYEGPLDQLGEDPHHPPSRHGLSGDGCFDQCKVGRPFDHRQPPEHLEFGIVEQCERALDDRVDEFGRSAAVIEVRVCQPVGEIGERDLGDLPRREFDAERDAADRPAHVGDRGARGFVRGECRAGCRGVADEAGATVALGVERRRTDQDLEVEPEWDPAGGDDRGVGAPRRDRGDQTGHLVGNMVDPIQDEQRTAAFRQFVEHRGAYVDRGAGGDAKAPGERCGEVTAAPLALDVEHDRGPVEPVGLVRGERGGQP